MKIEKSILKELVSSTASNAARQNNIFSCLRIIHDGNDIKIQSLNTMSIEAFAEVSEASEPFDVFVSAQNFARAVSHFGRNVEMSIDKGYSMLVLQEGAFVERLKIVGEADKDAWQFPSEPLYAFDIHETARRVLFNKIDQIPLSKMDGSFKGAVMFTSDGNDIHAFATSGQILSHRKYKLECGNFELRLPIRMASILATESGEMRVGIESQNNVPYRAMFKFKHVKYFTTLYNFPMPNLSAILECQKQMVFKVEAGVLRHAIERFADFSSVEVAWGNCELSLSAYSENGTINDVVQLEETYGTEGGKASYNPTYLLKVLGNLADEEKLVVQFAPLTMNGFFIYSNNAVGVVAGLKK